MENKINTPNPQLQVNRPIMRRINVKDKKNIRYVLVALIVVLAGVGSGWLLSGKARGGGLTGSKNVASGVTSGSKEAGMTDESTFRDSAEGTLGKGGIEGEGTHHLVRDGGPGSYVYLTSTVIDLESFSGKKVKVWGETISARKAGWLMDVGKIKVIE